MCVCVYQYNLIPICCYDSYRSVYLSKNITAQRVIQTSPNEAGIAVDSTNGNLYWISHFTSKLSRCNLDGSNMTILTTLRTPWVLDLILQTGITIDVIGN